MTDNNQFLYWLTLEGGKAVKFSDLAHLMAQAMHPDADDVELALCEIDITAELKQAVASGALVVRNPNTLGSHTLPLGAALKSAVLNPYTDLRSYLEARGIGLRLTPEGNGPVYWTLENAAKALQLQEGWHDGTRTSFLKQLGDAACTDELVYRDPRTDLQVKTRLVNTGWNTVTPADVNAWLDRQGVAYRWKLDSKAIQAKGTPAENGKRWTHEKLAELRDYRAKHTMPQTAAHFGISEARIRELDPRQKPKPKGYSAFNQRQK